MRYIKCAGCGRAIYEGETCLKHEYGSKFCSYKCLVVYGFYGHYSKLVLEESKLDDEKFINELN